MKLHVVLSLCFIITTSSFIGLEDIIVTIEQNGYDKIQFEGTVTIIPHSHYVLLWNCGQINLSDIKKSGPENHWVAPLVLNGQGLVLPFDKFKKRITLERNQKRLHLITLNGKDQGNQIQISFQTDLDREHIFDLIDHLQINLEIQTQLPSEEFLNDLLTGMEAYLNSYCKRSELKNVETDIIYSDL